jgi:LysM repeat protein
MYQNTSYRTSGGNNFLWVILSTLIIVILLFAVYINNRNSLGPVIAEVNSVGPANLADSTDAADSSVVVNPAEPTVKQPEPEPAKAEPAPTTTEPVTTEPAKTEPAKTEPKAETKSEAKVEPKADAKTTTKADAKAEAKAAAPVSGKGIMVDYEIKKGDVMGRIISRYNNSKDEIMKANELENLDKIKLGQVIKLRILAKHKVGKNETVGTLAAKYKVDSERIRKVNGIKEDKLKADEVVMIPLP